MAGQGADEWERFGVRSRDASVDGFDPYHPEDGGKAQSGDGKVRPRPGKEKRHLYRDDAVGETMRRWTLAMTDVPDEVLLDELERLRKGKLGSGDGQAMSLPTSRGARIKSMEGHNDNEKWLEFGVTTRRGKRKSMSVSGHEFVYGGPKRKSKFNIGSVEDDGEEDECSDDDACSDVSSTSSEHHHFTQELSPIVASPSSDSDWTTARRALLCCRDIIRTERSYLSMLHQLSELAYPSSSLTTFTSPLSSRTRTLIYTYLPDLIGASEAFLARLEDDPSAWGVSAALIGCEEEMEGAFVRWCGVVGEVFTDSSPNPVPSESTGTRSRVGSTVGFGLRGRSKSGVGERELESVYRPRAISWYDGVISPSQASTSFPAPPNAPPRPQTGLFTAALGTGLALGLSPPKHYATLRQTAVNSTFTSPPKQVVTANASGTLSKTFTPWRRKSVLSQSASNLPAFNSWTPAEKESGKKGRRGWPRGKKVATVRELAIQPTQRVTRYVLQYRDLLKFTPGSSPSRALVERALEAALKIAQRCDRAQGNSAFLRS